MKRITWRSYERWNVWDQKQRQPLWYSLYPMIAAKDIIPHWEVSISNISYQNNHNNNKTKSHRELLRLTSGMVWLGLMSEDLLCASGEGHVYVYMHRCLTPLISSHMQSLYEVLGMRNISSSSRLSDHCLSTSRTHLWLIHMAWKAILYMNISRSFRL